MKHKYKIGDLIYIKKNAAKEMYPDEGSVIDRLSKYENQIHQVTHVVDYGCVGRFSGRIYEILDKHWYSEEVIGYSQIEEILEIEDIL